MKKKVTDLISVDTSITTPVYKQIIQSIYRNIDNGVLNQNDRLPSVNSISAQFSLARGSVFTAYNDLRSAGIIDSIPGKGYFISSTRTEHTRKIFLLFNTITPYTTNIYQSVLRNLPANCTVDVYFHNHNIKTFESLIREHAAYYNTFVIMPELHKDTLSILSTLNQKQTFLLDGGLKAYCKDYPGVYQNFEKDIESALLTLNKNLSRYKRLFLIIPDSMLSGDIVSGFKQFCKTVKIVNGIKTFIEASEVKVGDAFIVTDDDDLVKIVQIAKANNWRPGKDIGVMSYNETSLKSVIAEGITTISSDFSAMGMAMVSMVVTGKKGVVENPFVLTDRKSF